MQRVVDLFLAFPIIILALAVVSILGTGVGNVIMAITVPMIPNCARVVRASALAVRQMPYVEAARAAGFGHGRIIFRHMLPNVMAPYLIMLTAYVGRQFCWRPRCPSSGSGWPSPRRPGDSCSEVRQWNLLKLPRGWPSSRGWPSAWASLPSISLATPCATPWTQAPGVVRGRENTHLIAARADRQSKRHFGATTPAAHPQHHSLLPTPHLRLCPHARAAPQPRRSAPGLGLG